MRVLKVLGGMLVQGVFGVLGFGIAFLIVGAVGPNARMPVELDWALTAWGWVIVVVLVVLALPLLISWYAHVRGILFGEERDRQHYLMRGSNNYFGIVRNARRR